MSYTFTIANNEQTITGWSGNNNIINIQLSPSNLNIKIAASAFLTKTFQLTNLVLPPTLIQVGSNAYKNASGINGTINLSSTTVNSIGDGAFMSCTGLTGSLSLSGLNLTFIGNSAFNGCNQLTTLTLPNSLTFLGAAAFNDCSGLTGMLQLSGLTLTVLNNTAFRNCSSLTNLVLPTTLISINQQTFQNCVGLTGLNLSNLTNLTSIGPNAFENCNSVTSLTLPTSLITLNNFSFRNNVLLTGPLQLLTLTNLNFIGSNAFQNCTNLTSLVLPSNVSTIGFGAFMNCNGLSGTLSLSNLTNLTSIGNDVFNSCNQLNSVTFPTSLLSTGLRSFFNCTVLTGLDLFSTNLTSIGQDSFNNCFQLNYVLFPSSLVSIGIGSFLNVLLSSIYFQSGCTIQNTSFTSSSGIVYSNTGISFTIGTGTGIISPTSNPFASRFSKWRLYNQPLPSPNDFFSSSVNTFYSQFIPQTNFTFFTYHVNGLTNYNIVVKDANGIVLTTTQQTVVPVGYLYTFNITLPNGSKTISLNNSALILNLIELECSIFGSLNTSYNQGETINITWAGTNPPYLLLFGGSGITPILITANLFANSFNFITPPVPPLTYRITIVNANGCFTNSSNFNVTPCITIIPMDAYYHDFITVNWIGFSTTGYTVSLIEIDGTTTFMATTNSTTLIWPIPTYILPGLYQVQVSIGDNCAILSNTFLIVTLQDICFVKDTLVETDQGNIPIQSIIPGKHTVFNQKIIDVTKTIHPDSHLVHIKAFSFGPYPNKDTTVSQEHKINGIGSFREAKHYVNGSTITLVPYDFQPLYNILLIRPGFMKVHGMMVETLDPYVMKHQPKRQMLKR